MPVPPYLAAVARYPGRPGQVNQLLVGHSTQFVYTGALRASQTTGSGVYASTNATYLATAFTTGSSQTAIGQIWLQVSAVGGSPTSAVITPLTVSVSTNSGGVPGTVLATTPVAEQFVYSAPFWLQVPFSLSGLSSSTGYWVVVAAAGTSAHYYAWQHSSQVSGAATSPDGVNWTTQAYGLMYEVYDQAPTGSLQYLISDSGARWVQFSYDSAGRYSTVAENTVAQDGSNLYSTRTFTYTNGLLSGVS